MKQYLTFGNIVCIVLLILSNLQVQAQCTGGSNGGSITPTNSWNTSFCTRAILLSFSATAGVHLLFFFLWR
ncbi:MAG: hypothetical protein R2847_08740 [Bacteroidia bacterium]